MKMMGEKPNESLTHILAAQASLLCFEELAADIVTVAKQCLLDWVGVSLAARNEALVSMLVDHALVEGGRRRCSVIGRPEKCSASQAALINGAMGHAIDYDDVIISMGHPTVPVAPVVLALGERGGRSGAEAIAAFVAGVEAEVRIARFAGPSHYARGFHSTATFGTFGAAAAAGNLLRLDANRMAMAFGIAGTQAAGLKSMFGTMCKPLHAGRAASSGLLAAELAARGFTSNPGILEAEQGFGATQSDDPDVERALQPAPRGFWIRETLFKYHAACYLTHSALNAAAEIRHRQAFAVEEIEHIEIGVDPGHLKVCAIPEPSTGLECKFSLKMTVAMMLSGQDTGSELAFSDDTAHRPALIDLRRKVDIRPRRRDSTTLSDVTIRLKDGRVLSAEHDVANPAQDLTLQWQALEAKFHALAEPALGDAAFPIVELLRNLEECRDLREITALLS